MALPLPARKNVWVKICGITNGEDARLAVELEANAIGINCWAGSKRFVPINSAASWLRILPARVEVVAVLVNPHWSEACEIAALPYVTALQFHGQETPEFCARIAAAGIQFSKAIPVGTAGLPERVEYFSTKTLLLDSTSGGAFGGTGKTFPWQIAREFARAQNDSKVIVAGGLTAQNVGEAIRLACPFGVDVTSGVESSPGRKDHRLLRDFFHSVRKAV